jgi:hypothetical protein
MKREIPLLITFFSCLVLILDFVIKNEVLARLAAAINDYVSILATFALVLGLASLFGVHFNRIYKKRENWGFSVVLVLGFAFSLLAYCLYGVEKEYEVPIPLDRYEVLSKAGEAQVREETVHYLLVDGREIRVGQEIFELDAIGPEHKKKKVFYYQVHSNYWFDTFIFGNVFTPLGATMFSLLAFFMASAAFRAFRAKSIPATLLLVSAFFVMLGRVPIGAFVGQWLEFILLPIATLIFPEAWISPSNQWFSEFAGFIMNVPNTAGQRAIMIGAALGMVAASLRIWIGLEKEHLGRD